MRKILFIISIAILFSLKAFALFPITKFLGIPVDGSKTEMIEKLKAKGFTFLEEFDVLQGKYEGIDVNLRVITHNDKVFRIMVSDQKPYDGATIKDRFNDLVHKFKNDKRFLDFDSINEFYIDDKVNLDHEILENRKEFQASFLIADRPVTEYNKTWLMRVANKELGNKYTADQMKHSTEAIDELCEVVSRLHADALVKRRVWFNIGEFEGKYFINLFYDNANNQPDDED